MRIEKNISKKSLVLLISIVVMLICVTGVTVAFITTKTDTVTNTFESAQVSCKVNEDFDRQTKKNVSIQNTSTDGVPAFIRAQVVVNWVKGDNVLAEKPVENVDYSLVMNANADENGGIWKKFGEYFYYSKPIDSGSNTGILISECKPLKACEEEGYTLSVEIIASAIQTTPTSAIENAWSGVTVNNGEIVEKN